MASPVRTQSYLANCFENSNFVNSAHDSLRLFDFWHDYMVGYFRTGDMLFRHAGIHDEIVKCVKLINDLSKNDNVMQSLVSVLQALSDQRYSDIREHLLQRFGRPRVTLTPAFWSHVNAARALC